jgi:predicted transcriptional regulator
VVDTELEQVAELTRFRMTVQDIAAELDMSKSSVQRLQVKAREAGLMED